VLPGTGGAALDEATEPDTVVTALDQPAIERRFFVPSELGEALLERLGIVAAVAFGGAVKVARRNLGQGIGNVRPADQVAPPELDRVDAEVARGELHQPVAEEAALESARRAIGAAGRLVAHQHHSFEMDVGNPVRAGEELHKVARRGQPVRAGIGADIDMHRAA
jgi:hypothetical protein